MKTLLTVGAWVWFCIVQLIMFVAMLVGLVVLIYPCMSQAWVLDRKSIKDGRPIDRWRSRWLAPFNNPEDGVSGQTALIWLDGVTQGPYLPDAAPAWRAYSWSALRNSADAMKYFFAWRNGPYTEFTIGARLFRIGWTEQNGVRVPVL